MQMVVSFEVILNLSIKMKGANVVLLRVRYFPFYLNRLLPGSSSFPLCNCLLHTSRLPFALRCGLDEIVHLGCTTTHPIIINQDWISEVKNLLKDICVNPMIYNWA